MAVRPDNEAGVVAALGDASTPVRIRGGGTSAVAAPEGALDLALDGLTGLVEHRPADLIARARAGTPLHEIAASLAPHGQRLPVAAWDRDARGTIGGLFAAGADGLRARLGFRARDILLGARAVLGNGDLVTVGANVVKSVAGFDVPKVLVGSRGTLAALTEVTFRVEAVPESTATVGFEFDDLDPVLDRARAAWSLSLAPSAVVVVAEAGRYRAAALLEGPRQAVTAAVDDAATLGLHRFAEDGSEQALSDERWVAATALDASPPPSPLTRITGRSGDAPMDAHRMVIDVARGRFTAWVDGHAPPPPPLTPLFERVRVAFDPTGRFLAGRGYGAR